MLKSRPIVGSATFTIVMSMMFMNIADTNTMPTAIFWFMWTTATFSFDLWSAVEACGAASAPPSGCAPDPMRSLLDLVHLPGCPHPRSQASRLVEPWGERRRGEREGQGHGRRGKVRHAGCGRCLAGA